MGSASHVEKAGVRVTWSGICAECGKPYKPGTKLVLDLETRKWVHALHVAAKISERNQQKPDYEDGVGAFRERVIATTKCPYCSAAPGERCRELGREREMLHRRRVTRHFTSVTLAGPC